MKFLKYFLFLIAFLVIAFVAVGFIHPSVNYGHEITVNKSVKEAWAVQQDASKFGQWLEGFKSIDLIEGEAGAVGSKYKVVVNPGEGQPDFEMTETVVSFKEFDHITMNFDSDMMLFDQTTFFAETDGKTTIRTKSEVKGKGMMMSSMFALMEVFGGAFQKQEVKNIEALKKVIEKNETDYYPVPAKNEVEIQPYFICYNNDSKPNMAISIYFDSTGKAQKVRYKGQTESIALKFEKEEYIEGGAHPTIINHYTEMYEGKPNGTYKLSHSGVWDYAEYQSLKDDKTFKFTIDHELAIINGTYRESPCY